MSDLTPTGNVSLTRRNIVGTRPKPTSSQDVEENVEISITKRKRIRLCEFPVKGPNIICVGDEQETQVELIQPDEVKNLLDPFVKALINHIPEHFEKIQHHYNALYTRYKKVKAENQKLVEEIQYFETELNREKQFRSIAEMDFNRNLQELHNANTLLYAEKDDLMQKVHKLTKRCEHQDSRLQKAKMDCEKIIEGLSDNTQHQPKGSSIELEGSHDFNENMAAVEYVKLSSQLEENGISNDDFPKLVELLSSD